MKKIKTVKKYDFKTGEFKLPQEKNSGLKSVGKVLSATAPVLTLVLPKAALAATVNGGFGNIHEAILNGFDIGVVIVIIFAGAVWAFGDNQSRAISILISVCCGYILARHAVDIRDFLKENI